MFRDNAPAWANELIMSHCIDMTYSLPCTHTYKDLIHAISVIMIILGWSSRDTTITTVIQQG